MLKTKDGYAKVIGTSYLGSSDYLLLSNGDSKAISSLSVNYATSAGNADTLDRVHLNGIFTAFLANSNATRLVIGGVTKDLTIPYASLSPFLCKNSTFNSTGLAGLQYYDGDMSNTTNNNSWSVPSSGWHLILHLPLSVRGYFTELSFPVNDVNGLAWRLRRSNSYYGWYRILDSNNYSSYVKKIGTSTVGSSSIPIYLNAGTPTLCSTTLGVSITGNAATATTLKTTRTLWGLSFNGTADVNGTLSGVAHILFNANNTYDIGSNSAASRYIYTYWLGAKSGLKLELGANNSSFGLGLCIDTNLNVGIGTNTPAYKLDVKGDIRATGQIIRNGSSLGWVNGRKGALLRETTSTGYHTLWSLKTTNGSWDFGEYNSSGWNNIPVLNYITDTNFNSGNNTTTYQIKFPLDSGTIALTKNIPSSLKNPYSLTTFGVVYDGSAAKVVGPSNFISLITEGTATVTDGTMFITSNASDSGFADTNAVNIPYKRKAIHLWEYIKAKTDSLYATKSHNHDDRYLKLTGGIMTGTINRRSGGSTISGRDHAIIRLTYAPGGSSWNPIACVDTETGTWTLGHLSSGSSDTNFHFCFSTNSDYNAGNNNGNYVTLRNKVGTIALLSDIPSSLKNPHTLTISLNGTSQGPYDGSAAKSINITPSSIGAATSEHNHDNRYLKLTGGTMQLGEGLKFHADENYFGTYSDARIISLLDGNGKVCDGGLIIDERATLDGKEYVTELLRIRDSEFKWRGSNILHSGNTYISNNKGYINSTEITLVNNADTVDGYHAYQLFRDLGWWNSSETHNANDISGNGAVFAYSTHSNVPVTGVLTTFSGEHDGYNWQMSKAYTNRALYIRQRNGDNGTWSNWVRLLDENDLVWDNIAGKPSAFNPAAHTHIVFKNNLMIKGTNGISDSASIHLGIGDSDTGFKWISDGKCLIYANNSAVGEWTSGGMNWFKNPTVNGNKVWNAGNDGSGSGLDADLLDGQHGSRYTRALGSINYITINVGGDANTYYPVVISNISDIYPMLFVNISRTYNEKAPDTWNTSTHKGGLTLTLLWNGSRYWDGNSSGTACYCVYKSESYSTIVGGLGNATGGKVVWLRGGGAVYHIHSMNGTSTSVTVYTSTYTDAANRSFSPKTTPEVISVRWPGMAQGADYATSASNADTATKVIVNLHTTNNANYPLVWSNLSNTNTVTENQLFKSWSDLYYNPKNKRLTVGGSVVASSFVKSGGTSLQLLRADGGIATFNWSGQSGLPTWLWGGNNLHSYYVYNPSNFRVAYASSAGNADTLDGLDSTKFLRQVVVPNNTENDFNTFSNMTLTGRVDPTTGASLKNAPWSGSGPAGGYGVLTYLFNGYDYGTQMAWEYGSNRIYIRNRHWGGSGVGSVWRTSWDKLALTTDIPNSLKNPYALTLKANGTTLAVYDGSSAKEVNFTYANVGAAPASHTHTAIVAEDLRAKYPGLILDPRRMKLSFLAASTLGIKNDGSYYDVITVRSYANSSGGSDNALLFSKNSNSLYHTRFAFGSTSSWGSPLLIIDSGNIGSQSVAYASKAGSVAWGNITGKPSSFTPASHNHSFTLGATTITTGETRTAINGPFAIYTDASAGKAFSIYRDSAAEGVKHWIDDSMYHIEYTNDEAVSSIAIRLIDTDLERATNKGADAKDVTVYLDCYRRFYPSSNNTGSIGISSSKWANMYATTFHGSLDGNATTATNSDTLDGYHASSLVKFYLSPMASDASADSAKSWFVNTMPSASGAIVYNVPGVEKTIIAGKSSGAHGHMLQLNYNDTYLRILRYNGGSWKSTDWEKISAGYADSAGSVAWSNISGRPSSLKNPYSLNIFGVTYDGSAAKTVTTSTFVSLLSEGTSTVTDGTMFITSYASNNGFADTNAVNVPYKRKASCLWSYIDSKVSSKYLPLAGGTMNGNARIGHGSGNLYIGSANNNGWVMTQDIASQSGTNKWYIKTSGAACFGNIHIASKTDGSFNSSVIECNSTICLNYFSSLNVSLCNGGGNVKVGHADFGLRLNVAGSGYFSDTVYSNTLNHTSSTGHLIIGNKTKEISIRSSDLPDVPAVYLLQKFSTNVYYTANKGFGIRPYYLSSASMNLMETISGNKYTVVKVGDDVLAISCIIADKVPLMSQIKGTLIRFLPGDDGLIVLLKDLNNYGNGNGYLYVLPKNCNIVRSDNSNIFIADGNISSAYDDSKSRFFIYAKTYNVWIEFYCG